VTDQLSLFPICRGLCGAPCETPFCDSCLAYIREESRGGGVEIYAPVPGHPGYMVSSFGRVKSVDRLVVCKNGAWRRRLAGRVLKPSRYSGYPVVVLDGRRSVRVHSLMLTAFVGPCPAGMEACHWNDVRSDNRLSNLRWDSSRANHRDALRNGRNPQANKTHCPAGHPYSDDNLISLGAIATAVPTGAAAPASESVRAGTTDASENDELLKAADRDLKLPQFPPTRPDGYRPRREPR